MAMPISSLDATSVCDLPSALRFCTAAVNVSLALRRPNVFRYWSILIKVNYCSRLFDVFSLSSWQAEVPYDIFVLSPSVSVLFFLNTSSS